MLSFGQYFQYSKDVQSLFAFLQPASDRVCWVNVITQLLLSEIAWAKVVTLNVA
jgi:hypothetical protein